MYTHQDNTTLGSVPVPEPVAAVAASFDTAYARILKEVGRTRCGAPRPP